ncbi:MAG: hypothetical protein ABL907_18785 [Hyphomicrobium sp.]
MESKIIVMIVQLAMPNGDAGVQVKPMATAEACRSAAEIEASDPFVAGVECSELIDGVLKLNFKKLEQRRIPETANYKSTG